MTLPKPEAGLLIHYSYLWHRQARAGRDEGVKNRPCAIVGAVTLKEGPPRVYVLPVTHTEPRDKSCAVELPAKVKKALGLDDQRSWVMCDEANIFVWPGTDMARLPDGRFSYGFLPPGLFRQIKEKFTEQLNKKEMRPVMRDDNRMPQP